MGRGCAEDSARYNASRNGVQISRLDFSRNAGLTCRLFQRLFDRAAGKERALDPLRKFPNAREQPKIA